MYIFVVGLKKQRNFVPTKPRQSCCLTVKEFEKWNMSFFPSCWLFTLFNAHSSWLVIGDHLWQSELKESEGQVRYLKKIKKYRQDMAIRTKIYMLQTVTKYRNCKREFCYTYIDLYYTLYIYRHFSTNIWKSISHNCLSAWIIFYFASKNATPIQQMCVTY